MAWSVLSRGRPVVNRLGAGKVPGPQRFGRNRRCGTCSRTDSSAFIAEEEERAIFDNAPAGGAAELVLPVFRLRMAHREEVGAVQFVVAEKLIQQIGRASCRERV